MDESIFFFVNESDGKNFTESMFSAVIKENELIPKIFYLDSGNLIAVSDRALYGIGSDGKEKWSIELTNHIDYIGVEKRNILWWLMAQQYLVKTAGKQEM